LILIEFRRNKVKYSYSFRTNYEQQK